MRLFVLSQGLVHIPEPLVPFVHTSCLQRLTRVKMGLWWCVYPSAVETRFTHSIEVMVLAEKVLDVMGVRCPRVRKLVMVGALYHDVGHVALSHALDHDTEALTGLVTKKDRVKLCMRYSTRSTGSWTRASPTSCKRSSAALSPKRRERLWTRTTSNGSRGCSRSSTTRIKTHQTSTVSPTSPATACFAALSPSNPSSSSRTPTRIPKPETWSGETVPSKLPWFKPSERTCTAYATSTLT